MDAILGAIIIVDVVAIKLATDIEHAPVNLVMLKDVVALVIVDATDMQHAAPVMGVIAIVLVAVMQQGSHKTVDNVMSLGIVVYKVQRRIYNRGKQKKGGS